MGVLSYNFVIPAYVVVCVVVFIKLCVFVHIQLCGVVFMEFCVRIVVSMLCFHVVLSVG